MGDFLIGKLSVPARFVPYMEKHRIYELFHDLGNELAMHKPEDHLSFIKDCLVQMKKIRDTRLIILIVPPNVDRITLAQIISKMTGYEIISRYIMCKQPGNFLDPTELAVNTAEHIRLSFKDGWLLADYPDSVQEAKALIRNKVIPTHTFLLVDEEGMTKSAGPAGLNGENVSTTILNQYENTVFNFKDIFKSSLIVLKTRSKVLEEIASVIVAKFTVVVHFSKFSVATEMPNRIAPKLFRVALIGSKGSRRKTLAKLLQTKFNLVHVDVLQLIEAAKRQSNEAGKELNKLDAWKHPYSNQLVFELVKGRLNAKDCLDRGYVLTNYPRSRQDFLLLDSTDTPPNKVIFLDINSSECKDRLEQRRVNMYTGSLHTAKEAEGNAILKIQTLTHPDDEACEVEQEIRFYERHVRELMDYCGKTAFVINASGPTNSVLERVEFVLMASTPTAPTRSEMYASKLSATTKESDSCLYPIAQDQIVPMIDLEELFSRYRYLISNSSESSVVDEFEKMSIKSVPSHDDVGLYNVKLSSSLYEENVSLPDSMEMITNSLSQTEENNA